MQQSSFTTQRSLVGRIGEKVATRHARFCGYRVIDSNFRVRGGELDLVYLDGEALAFCEVKARIGYRKDTDPLESITRRKQERIRALASEWLSQNAARTKTRARFQTLRFDVIGILLSRDLKLIKVEHIKNAF